MEAVSTLDSLCRITLAVTVQVAVKGRPARLRDQFSDVAADQLCGRPPEDRLDGIAGGMNDAGRVQGEDGLECGVGARRG